MNDTPKRERLTRALARLTLAVSRQARPKAPCPGAEELALWQAGTLASERRQAVTDHLGHCSKCYEAWAFLVEAEPLLAGLRATVARSVRRPAPGWQQRLTAWWGGSPWLFSGGLGTLAAAVLVVVVMLPVLRHPSPDTLIESGYQTMTAQPVLTTPESTGKAPGKDLTTKSLSMKGAAEPESDPVTVAFASGARQGLEQLAAWSGAPGQERLANLPTSAANQEEPALPAELTRQLHGLGRWAVLMQAACGESAPTLAPAFWQQQRKALIGLQAALAKEFDTSTPSRDAADHYQRLNRLAFILEAWVDQVTTTLDNEAATSQEAICSRADTFLDTGLGR